MLERNIWQIDTVILIDCSGKQPTRADFKVLRGEVDVRYKVHKAPGTQLLRYVESAHGNKVYIIQATNREEKGQGGNSPT